MVPIVLSAVGLAVTVVLAALAVARGLGRLESHVAQHGDALQRHRDESTAATAAVRADLAAVREDLVDVRERVAGLEATQRLKVVR